MADFDEIEFQIKHGKHLSVLDLLKGKKDALTRIVLSAIFTCVLVLIVGYAGLLYRFGAMIADDDKFDEIFTYVRSEGNPSGRFNDLRKIWREFAPPDSSSQVSSNRLFAATILYLFYYDRLPQGDRQVIVREAKPYQDSNPNAMYWKRMIEIKTLKMSKGFKGLPGDMIDDWNNRAMHFGGAKCPD